MYSKGKKSGRYRGRALSKVTIAVEENKLCIYINFKKEMNSVIVP